MSTLVNYVLRRLTAAEYGEFAIARALATSIATGRRQVREYVRRLPHLKARAEAEHVRQVLAMLTSLADTQPATVAKVLFISDKADIPEQREILEHIQSHVSNNTRDLIERHLKSLACSMRH